MDERLQQGGFEDENPFQIYDPEGNPTDGTPKAKKKKSFPDLNKDGKITKADILKGRGVFSSGSKPLKPKGPGVLRPKPKDRYGQVLKTKPIKGKK